MRYRFINRDGWERWLKVDPPTLSVVVPERPAFPPQGQMVDGGVRMARTDYRRRMFERCEWQSSTGALEVIYVEDGDTSLLHDAEDGPGFGRENAMAQALRAIAKMATDDAIHDVINTLSDETIGRDPRYCYIHSDCRKNAKLALTCKETRTMPKESTDT